MWEMCEFLPYLYGGVFEPDEEVGVVLHDQEIVLAAQGVDLLFFIKKIPKSILWEAERQMSPLPASSAGPPPFPWGSRPWG